MASAILSNRSALTWEQISSKKYNGIYIIEEFPIFTERLLLAEKQYNKTKNKNPFFSYEYNIPDPFHNIDNPDSPLNNLLAWYQRYNPNFVPINQCESAKNMIEYEPLLVNMGKHLIVLLYTNAFPNRTNNNLKNEISKKNNTERQILNRFNNDKQYLNNNKSRSLTFIKYNSKNINTLKQKYKQKSINLVLITGILSIINECLQNFEYLQIVDACDAFLNLFSTGDCSDSSCIRSKFLLKQTLNTPFFVYPTFMYPSYTKVLYFMSAPVINFNISIRRKNIHDVFSHPYLEIQHDIEAHASHTHDYLQNTTNTSQFKDKYIGINKFIEMYKPYITYNFEKITINNINDLFSKKLIIEMIKFCIALGLFYIYHEYDGNKIYENNVENIAVEISNINLMRILEYDNNLFTNPLWTYLLEDIFDMKNKKMWAVIKKIPELFNQDLFISEKDIKKYQSSKIKASLIYKFTRILHIILINVVDNNLSDSRIDPQTFLDSIIIKFFK